MTAIMHVRASYLLVCTNRRRQYTIKFHFISFEFFYINYKKGCNNINNKNNFSCVLSIRFGPELLDL